MSEPLFPPDLAAELDTITVHCDVFVTAGPGVSERCRNEATHRIDVQCSLGSSALWLACRQHASSLHASSVRGICGGMHRVVTRPIGEAS